MVHLIAIAAAATITPIQMQVSGDGYFELRADNGMAYVKSGRFSAVSGLLTHESGFPVQPPIRVPSHAGSLNVRENGELFSVSNGSNSFVGQITIAKFPKSAQPATVKGLFVFLERPAHGKPGSSGFGTIHVTTAASAVLQRPVHGTTITIRERSEVFGPRITIGDVCDVHAPAAIAASIRDAVIGASPLVDTPRALTAASIQSALRGTHIPLDGIQIVAPARAAVVRAARTITGALIWEQAKLWLEETSQNLGEIRLATVLADRRVPAGDLEFSFRKLSETSRSIVVVAEARIGAERLFSQQLVVNTTASGSATSAVPASAPVKVGQTVRVLMIAGSVVVETTGRVTWSGPEGRVRVAVEPTRSEVIGVVKSDGSVEVNL